MENPSEDNVSPKTNLSLLWKTSRCPIITKYREGLGAKNEMESRGPSLTYEQFYSTIVEQVEAEQKGSRVRGKMFTHLCGIHLKTFNRERNHIVESLVQEVNTYVYPSQTTFDERHRQLFVTKSGFITDSNLLFYVLDILEQVLNCVKSQQSVRYVSLVSEKLNKDVNEPGQGDKKKTIFLNIESISAYEPDDDEFWKAIDLQIKLKSHRGEASSRGKRRLPYGKKNHFRVHHDQICSDPDSDQEATPVFKRAESETKKPKIISRVNTAPQDNPSRDCSASLPDMDTTSTTTLSTVQLQPAPKMGLFSLSIIYNLLHTFIFFSLFRYSSKKNRFWELDKQPICFQSYCR
jgi:hypothetical protein